jgi:dihydrofolate synthase/folylpolyglutamate synthase
LRGHAKTLRAVSIPNEVNTLPAEATAAAASAAGLDATVAPSVAEALADIAAPVEKKLRRIAGHEFRAFGIAWTMAQNRLRDARD